MRFLRGRFAALLPRMSCFPVATCRSDYPANTHFDACFGNAVVVLRKPPATSLRQFGAVLGHDKAVIGCFMPP